MRFPEFGSVNWGSFGNGYINWRTFSHMRLVYLMVPLNSFWNFKIVFQLAA